MADKKIINDNITIKKFSNFKNIKPVTIFFIVALSISFGFFVGGYKYQIMASIAPVFGYKAHSVNLDFSSLQETYNKLASNYDGELDPSLLIEGANRGLVAAAGDDYTNYMSVKESAEFNDSLAGKIGGGIGAEIGIKNDKITIIRALPDNPALKAGLHANDIVLAINDEATDGWNVEKAVGSIRGEEGTTVKLSIQRDSEVKNFTITREIINNPSVEGTVVDGIGILTISRFDDQTGSLSRLAAQGFKKQAVKGIILDLRGNGGGYVEAARDVAGLWLNDKIVMTEKTGGIAKNVVRTGNNPMLSGLPTVILINGGSASASEIVAGALRDYGLAKLVGEKSFGKGTMQQLLSLDSGAMIKVTIARWFTPNDVNINKSGIEPDYTIELTQADINKGIDTQINEAKRVLSM